MSTIAMTGMEHGMQRCEGCTLLSRPAHGEEEGRCPRCGAHLEYRKARSVQRTWALLIAAAICCETVLSSRPQAREPMMPVSELT